MRLKQSNSKLIYTAGNKSKVLFSKHQNKFDTEITDKTLKQNKDHLTPEDRMQVLLISKKGHTPYIYN